MSETAAILKIALPLIAAYLAEYAMFLTTKIIVGRLGYEELAAVGLAGNMTFEVLVVLMGLLSIVGVLAAQAAGRGRTVEVGQAARQGLVVATVLGIPATVLIWNLAAVFELAGQDAVVVALSQPFLHTLSGIVLPTLWFAVLRNFVAALARTTPVMLITVSAVGLNYALTLMLVHGVPDRVPALGVAGAGLAMSIAAWFMFIALGLVIFFSEALRGYGLFAAKLRLEPAVCAEIIRLGIPVAGLVGLEAGLFVAVATLSGLFGAKPLAAFEVLISWIGIPFVIALGLAEASMVRVAYGVGRNNLAAARRSGLLGMACGILLLALLVIVPLNYADALIAVFLQPDDPGFADVAALVKQLLFIVVLFQVFDGLQAIASRALRGLKDTIAPLWLAAFGYWGLGIGGGTMLAFPLGWAAPGLWWGLASGLIVTAVLLAWRFNRLTRPPLGAGRTSRNAIH